MSLGFSENEAKSYVSLLQESPVSAYELAKLSGVPSSKIYEVIARLCEKGAAIEITDQRTPRYLPAEPDELLARHRHTVSATIDSLGRSLALVRNREALSYVRSFNDYGTLITESEIMIGAAQRSVLLSGWPEELSALVGLVKKRERALKTVVVWYGDDVPDISVVYPHPVKDALFAEKGGRQFVLCVDDSVAIIATVAEGRVQASMSRNSGFVTLARDYISHDVYILKVVNRFGPLLEQSYGCGYPLLRDIYSDEVIK